MKTQHAVFLIFVLVNVLFSFLCNCSNLLVNFSFILNFVSISIISFYHLFKEKQFSPFISSYLIFTYLFFFIAPISQIINLPQENNTEAYLFLNAFPNTLPYNALSVIKLNIFITLWNLFFYISYHYFKKRSFKNSAEWKISTEVKGNFPLTILLIAILSLGIVLSQSDYIVKKTFYHEFISDELPVSQVLIIMKTLFSIPFIGLILAITYLRNTKKLSINKLLIFASFLLLLVLFMIVKNPLMEKRNALGPIFITLFIFVTPELFRTNKRFFSFLFLSMIVAFPLLSILTHAKVGISILLNNPKLYLQSFQKNDFLLEFNSLHYDAYANVLATMDYVSNHGIVFGKNLFAGLFFFIPRSIWESKPDNTGQFIGQYLMKNYRMWYDNISNPFLSEGIINFGYLSLLIFPALLSWFIVKMLKWQYSNELLKQVVAIYFSIHLIFFLRGDFTNGWAYFIGTFIGIYIIPKSILVLLKYLPKKKPKH